jgi:hypothetical protein
MTIRSPALSLALASALSAFAVLATISPAEAEDVVEMAFEGFGPAGLRVMTTHTVIEETPTRYLIEGDFATAGIGALFANVSNRSVARGQQQADTPHPESFDSETARDGVVVHNRVAYQSDGTPSGSSLPPPKEPITPVEANQLRGAVDNLTAYLLLERQIARGGSCNLRVPVFDGRHRYDLSFSDAGNTVLSPAEGQNFKGPAHECRMVRNEIGGFYVDKRQAEGARSGTIWYAQLMPGDIAVPVRMQMQTEIGDVEIYLSHLRGRGVDLKLMD